MVVYLEYRFKNSEGQWGAWYKFATESTDPVYQILQEQWPHPPNAPRKVIIRHRTGQKTQWRLYR